MEKQPIHALIHGADKVVDVLLSVAILAALHIVLAFDINATLRCGQLEGPQEIGCLLECWANCEDLMDQVLNADYVVRPQCLFSTQIVNLLTALV